MKNKTAILLFIIALSISGCSNVKFHGKLIDDVGQHIYETFANEHQVNITSSESDKPKKIFYVIDSDEKYDLVFNSDYKIDVNYEQQFLILCSFVSIYNLEHSLDKLDVSDNVLIIKCKANTSFGRNWVCAPYQRWCAIKMDVVEYSTIDFTGE